MFPLFLTQSGATSGPLFGFESPILRLAVWVAEGASRNDPLRVAVYFTKHGSAKYWDKDYQNRPPEEWLADGKVLGRFWGYWLLDAVEVAVPFHKHRAVYAASVLRRWARASRECERRSPPRRAHRPRRRGAVRR